MGKNLGEIMNNIMKYKGYWAEIRYSDEDECFYGIIEGLKNTSISFEGTTVNIETSKEADIEKEMGKVSSVFHNRLNASYNRLESDVTIHYIEKYVKPFIEGDKNRYNELYNTYKCYGLPAGPICNPGIASIKAALNPEKTDYMFFFTDKDMNYYYSKTYKEHKDKWNNLDNK